MESSNLMIRESVFSDCALFAEWEKKDYIQEAFTMSSDRDYEQIVKEFIIRTYEPDKLQFTIVYREEEKPIGRICISRKTPMPIPLTLRGYISAMRPT